MESPAVRHIWFNGWLQVTLPSTRAREAGRVRLQDCAAGYGCTRAAQPVAGPNHAGQWGTEDEGVGPLRKHEAHEKELDAADAEASAVIDERRELLASADAVASYAERLSGLLDSSAAAAKKMFLRSFVKEIWVQPGWLTIHYTIPTPRELAADPDDKEAGLPSPAPASVQYGVSEGNRTGLTYDSALAPG